MKVRICLNLEERDLWHLKEKAAERGIKASELLENFVNDLVCGTYTNGSDERIYANDWFDRCSFDNCNKNTFLRFLYDENILEDFVANCVDYFNAPMIETERWMPADAKMKEIFAEYCESEYYKKLNPQFDEEMHKTERWAEERYKIESSAEVAEKELLAEDCESEHCKKPNPQFDKDRYRIERYKIFDWYNDVHRNYTPEIKSEIDMEM